MIVSHEHRFVFLHARKTAGTSIMTSLSRYLGPDDVCLGDVELAIRDGFIEVGPRTLMKNLRPRDLGLVVSRRRREALIASPEGRESPWTALRATGYRRAAASATGLASAHSTAAEVRRALGERRWCDYFKFVFVRNFWDRFLSFYFWRTRSLSPRPSFASFLDAIHRGDRDAMRRLDAEGWDNYPIYTIDGQVAVDFVGRFENLGDDVAEAARRIGLPFDGWLPREKGTVKPAGARREDYYDEESIDRVARLFHDEIALFGYEYGA